MLRKIVSAMARGRNGMALLPVAIGVAAVGILVYSVLRWYFSMIQGTADLGDRLEMQIITQEYLGRINAATYDEIVQTAAAKGSSWTEDVRDGKYEARIEIGEDGKFADAKCDTEATIGDGDKRCRTATITLTSKSDPAQVMNLSTISVATTGRIPEIQRRLSAQDDRFGEYYTKGESDDHFACPWDYKMNAANTKCEPCNAPTWKQYRNGNCSLYTCPTGQKANAEGNGCEQIVCPSNQILVEDNCLPKTPIQLQYVGQVDPYCRTVCNKSTWGHYCQARTNFSVTTGNGWVAIGNDPSGLRCPTSNDHVGPRYGSSFTRYSSGTHRVTAGQWLVYYTSRDGDMTGYLYPEG